MSISNIANSLGLSREYTEKYLLYLEQALLVKRLKKYSKSIEKSLRSMDKVHLLDPGLINAFSSLETGHVLESLVASHLLRREGERVYYFREKYEVDLVLEAGKEILPVEIKYKDEISRRELSGIYSFSRKFKSEISLMITRDLLKEESSGGLRVIYLPAWLFLLLSEQK